MPAVGGGRNIGRRRGIGSVAGEENCSSFSCGSAVGGATERAVEGRRRAEARAAIWPLLTRFAGVQIGVKMPENREKIQKTLKKPKKTCGNLGFAIDKAHVKSHC